MDQCEYRTQYPLCLACSAPMNTAHVCRNNDIVPRADKTTHKYVCVVHGKPNKHGTPVTIHDPCMAIDPGEPTDEQTESNLFNKFNSTPSVPSYSNGTDYLRNVVSHQTGVGTTEVRAIVADPPPEENHGNS